MPLYIQSDIYGFTINSTKNYPILAVYGKKSCEGNFKICYVKGSLNYKLIKFSKPNLINTEGFLPIPY